MKNMTIVEVAKSIAQALQEIDKDLRSVAGTCPKCGKATSGVVLAGQSKEQAGICACSDVEDVPTHYTPHNQLDQGGYGD